MGKMNLEKFMRRINKEAHIKSLICGFSVSLLIISLLIILFKLLPLKIIVWLHIILFVLLGGCLSFAFYAKIFKPNEKLIANRLEKDVKLDERVKTMVEYKDVDSLMVNLQRETTIKVLDKVPASSLKLRFSFFNFALSILAVIALSFSIIMPAKEVISNANANDVVVTYLDGNKVLEEVIIKSGQKAEEKTFAKSGYDFIDWYENENLVEEFDFSKPIKQNTNIYAKFRTFYILGAGTSEILKTSNQGSVITSKHRLVKSEEGHDYTITAQLNAGDIFIFASNTNLYNSRGFGYLTETSKNGVEYFTEIESEFVYDNRFALIGVLESATFTITLSTDPTKDLYDTESAEYSKEIKDYFNYSDTDTITFEVSSNEGESDNTISDAIDNMQQEVENNEQLDDENKEEINQELEDLEQDLNNNESKEENDESIEQSKEDINQTIDEQITKDEIGEALKNQESTEELGDSVSEGDTEQTETNLDEIRESLKDLTGDELKEALENLAGDIDKALEESGVDSSDPLYEAFKNFSDNLKQDAENSNDSNIQDQIDETFEQAKDEINEALNNQNSLEDLKESLNQQLDNLQQQVGSGQQNGEQQPSDEDGQEGNGEGEGDQTGENSGGDGGSPGDGELIYASDDLIYDPNTNSYVTYGELLNYYYERVLQGMEDGQVPEDLQSLINDYFSSLWNNDDDDEGGN